MASNFQLLLEREGLLQAEVSRAIGAGEDEQTYSQLQMLLI